MAIADTDPSKKCEPFNTSTGTSKNKLDNGAKKMLTDQSTSKLSANRNYFNIKDFAFNMPGGWDNQTVSIFVLTCKKHKTEFLQPCDTAADGLKIWHKIVKKCSEESNNNSVFNVNNVIELAQSLKEYVLRNENKKNEEDFNLLYNDVSDLLEYFPSETIDSNLTMRHRTRSESLEMKPAPNPEPTPSKWTSSAQDSLIIKTCGKFHDLMSNPKSSAKSFWSKVSQQIFEETGTKIDVKKYLSIHKRGIIKTLRQERDRTKRASMFHELIGDYKAIFDYMPPRTVKMSDFTLKEELQNGGDTCPVEDNNSGGNINHSDVPNTEEQIELQNSDKSNLTKISEDVASPRPLRSSSRLSNPSENKEKITHFSSRDKVFTSEDSEVSCSLSEPDSPPGRAPVKRKRGKPLGSNHFHVDEVESKKLITDSHPRASSSGMSDDQSTRSPGYPRVPTPVISKPKPNESSEPKSSWETKGRLKEAQEEPQVVEVSQPVPNNTASSSSGKLPSTAVESPMETDKGECSAGSPGSFGVSGQVPQVRLDSTQPIGKPVQPSNTVDKSGPRLVADHHSELPRPNHTPAEADHSQSAGDSEPRPGPSHVISGVSQLDKLDSNTLRLIEGYKQKMKESHASQAILQVIPRTGSTAQQVAVSSSRDNSQNNQAVLPTNGTQHVSCPPSWFDLFVTDYKKHEMWKMHQLLKMQQELVDIENKKLSVLERILGSLIERPN